jgi:hypothetical protein
MRIIAALLLSFCMAQPALWPTIAAAQVTIVLAPMTVENFRMLQRVSRNGGWTGTAYKNYLVGLFEGLLHAEGGAENATRLFCLPAAVRDGGKIIDIFDWMDHELNIVVGKAQPNAQVARIYAAHLSQQFPCTR